MSSSTQWLDRDINTAESTKSKKQPRVCISRCCCYRLCWSWRASPTSVFLFPGCAEKAASSGRGTGNQPPSAPAQCPRDIC